MRGSGGGGGGKRGYLIRLKLVIVTRLVVVYKTRRDRVAIAKRVSGSHAVIG